MKGMGPGRTAIIALSLLATAAPGNAFGPLPDDGPLPFARPQGQSAAAAAILGVTADSLAASAAAGAMAQTAIAEDVAALKNALDALAANDLDEARRLRDKAARGTIDHKIMTWVIATSGASGVRSGEIAEAAKLLKDWPGIGSLREHSERAMFRENPGPRIVLEAFGRTRPETVQGVILLARAHLAVGNATAARLILGRMWRTEKLDAQDDNAILREFGTVITTDDHRFRMERMLYAERFASASRLASRAGAPDLAKAFVAAARNQKNADALLTAVPEAQRSAAHMFAHARLLRRSGKYREAANMMLAAPTDRASLVDPDAWWVERRVLSRELLDIGDPQTAYKVAAAHAAESPAMVADAEFHAGWYALRHTGDAKTAAEHFARIAKVADGPISLSRAHYWLGRAAEVAGSDEARAHFEKAAAYGTAFYGQLAAAKLGRTTILDDAAEADESGRKAFMQLEAVQAIDKLERAGNPRRAQALYRSLAQELDDVTSLALLAELAENRGDHFLALRIGKWAAARGLPVGALSHPVGAIPEQSLLVGPSRALAYAVARQESEFNVSARSGAGALGLLQLLPGTAREMARKSGLTWSPGRLTDDPAYNATLGSAYLDEQLSRFAGSYVLTFAGYNAGPRRAQQWIERYGDPRGKDIETVVDWIERIPFTETRAYVQRVMENYQVYKMRLSGQVDIVADLVHGRR